MARTIVHTKYRLALDNPFRIYGYSRLALGGILFLMGVGVLRSLAPNMNLEQFVRDVARSVQEGAGRLSYLVWFVMRLVFGSIACVSGIGDILVGIKTTGRLYLPSKVPEDLHDPKLLRNSLRQREILTYRAAPNLALKLLRSMVSDAVEFLPPSHRWIVATNTSYLPIALVPLVLIVVIGQLRGTLHELCGVSVPGYGFPAGWFALVIIIGVLRGAIAWLLLPREVPAAEFERATQNLGGAGHPRTFMTELEHHAEEFRYLDLPNRMYLRQDSNGSRTEAIEGTGSVSGEIMLETQPEPVYVPPHPAGYLALGAGVALSLLGILLLTNVPCNPRSTSMAWFISEMLPVTLFHSIAGVVAWRNGRRFMREARDILGRMLFKSDVFDVEYSGTIYAGEIAAGMAATDSIRSSSRVVRSEVAVHYYCACVVSESVGFTGRHIVSAFVDNRLRERLRHLQKALEEHQKRGAQLVGIDIAGSQAVADLSAANVALASAKAAAAARARRDGTMLPGSPVTHALLGGGQQQAEGDEEWKECPACAEQIRRKARKCKFCGHTFTE